MSFVADRGHLGSWGAGLSESELADALVGAGLSETPEPGGRAAVGNRSRPLGRR